MAIEDVVIKTRPITVSIAKPAGQQGEGGLKKRASTEMAGDLWSSNFFQEKMSNDLTGTTATF